MARNIHVGDPIAMSGVLWGKTIEYRRECRARLDAEALQSGLTPWELVEVLEAAYCSHPHTARFFERVPHSIPRHVRARFGWTDIVRLLCEQFLCAELDGIDNSLASFHGRHSALRHDFGILASALAPHQPPIQLALDQFYEQRRRCGYSELWYGLSWALPIMKCTLNDMQYSLARAIERKHTCV